MLLKLAALEWRLMLQMLPTGAVLLVLRRSSVKGPLVLMRRILFRCSVRMHVLVDIHDDALFRRSWLVSGVFVERFTCFVLDDVVVRMVMLVSWMILEMLLQLLLILRLEAWLKEHVRPAVFLIM